MHKNKILVTGGAGFIGSHTVDLLLQQNFHVVVLDNLESGRWENLNLKHPHLTCIHGDVLDKTAIEKALIDCDAVLHLAAIPSVPKSLQAPIRSLQINTQGFLQLLEVVREKPIRVIYASSAAVYGNTENLPCSDETPLTAASLSPYALEKTHNENYADLYSRLYGLSCLGLRYFNVYGSRQDPHSPYSGVISRFIADYQHQNELVVYGDGRQSRDFIHVSDVARANSLALQSTYCGVLNIATGVPETLMNLIQYLETAGDKKARYRFDAARSGDIRSSYAAIEKAAMAIDFRHRVSLLEGIRELLELVEV